MQELDRKINDYRQQMNNLDDSRKEMRGEITVKLQNDRSTNLNLELSYIIQNAGWFPLYNIRAETVFLSR